MADAKKYSVELWHYASPYYDPQKAHEYYLRRRQLKGRVSQRQIYGHEINPQTTTTNEIKDKLVRPSSEIKSAKKVGAAFVKRYDGRDTWNSQIIRMERHKTQMNNRIATLRGIIHGMNPEERKNHADAVQERISRLQRFNQAERERLTSAYGIMGKTPINK